MTALKGLNLAGFARPKLPAPRVVPNATREFESVVREETHAADATIAVTDAILSSTPGGAPAIESDEANISDSNEKLSRLIDDDFPFDDSQLLAVGGLVQQQYGCLIGAAGTGKTTVTKKFVDMLRDGLDEIDVSQYWKRGLAEEHDDYEIPEKLIPSILMCSFTGRSTQMTKKNFPKDWHGNIMTIHRALGFYPEFYPDVDLETGQMVNKRRFVPSYTAENLMPWDIVIIDECGMLGLDLWHQLYAACKPGCRIYMIGDINQLPPTHGKSILGFALGKWPTWELTHVHRQQGANNSIVDNAHRVLKGLRPVSDSPEPLTIRPDDKATDTKSKMMPMLKTLTFLTQNKDWRFVTVDIEEEHKVAAIRLRQMFKLLKGKIYEPNRDVIITPINGFEQTNPGYALGQQPLNQELVIQLNEDAPRYIIDGGREKKNFAVGDKVMATVNDYEAGVTNGMTGIIKSISENGAYMGDTNRFGLISEVNDYFAGLIDDESDEDVEFDLDEMVADSSAGMEEFKKREKGERGPGSHIIDVEFGEGDAAFTISFGSKSQIASLMLAYVATCHKMQGGECPLVFVICHQAHKRGLNREWLYTAITRGSQRVVLLQTRQGVSFGVGKQTIKGQTLNQKIKSFQELTESGILGPTVRVKLPQAASLVTDVTIPPPVRSADRVQPKVEPQVEIRERVVIRDVHIHLHEAPAETAKHEERVIDGGDLKPQPKPNPLLRLVKQAPVPAPQLPAPAKLVSQTGAYLMQQTLTEPRPLALTHQPPKKTNPLAALLAKQKALKK